MKKIKFKQDSELPDKVIGISSLYIDFRIAWVINNTFQLNLSKAEDISIEVKRNEKNEILNFSLFSDKDFDENYYFLLSNKDKGKNLSLKYKNIDYFLIIKSNMLSMQNILANLNDSKSINGIFILPADLVLKRILSKLFEQ